MTTWLDLLPIELQDIIYKEVTASKMQDVLKDLIEDITDNEIYSTHGMLCEKLHIDDIRYGDSLFWSAKEWHEWLLQQDLIGPRIIEIDTIINRSSPYILYLNELSYQELLSFKSFIKKN